MSDRGVFRTFHDKPLTAADRLAIRGLSFDVRKSMVDDMHVGYPGFRAATAFVRKRHWPVEKATTHGVGKFHALFGEWRTGKSRVVEHYAAHVNAARERKDKTPVVHVECGSGWGAKQVFIGILRKLTGSAPSASNSLDNLCDLTANVMQALGVEFLVLDDLGEVLNHRGGQHAGPLLSHLKIILDRRFCNIMGVGPSTLFPLLRNTFGYIGGRGGLMHHVMPTLDWHGKDDQESYRMLLDDMDSLLPFPKKSGLGIPRYAAHFYDLSAGSIGYTASYVAAAAMLALDEDANRIEHRHLVEMAVSGRDPADRFTHFADELDTKLVGRRQVRK